MSKIIQEQEVSLAILAEHLEEAGWDAVLESNRIVMHSPRGLGFSIHLDDQRQFLIFSTDLPFSSDYGQRVELVNTLNSEVFLGSFSLDDDGDLHISYAMSYERGLILGQLARINRRFSGLLEHVVNHFDKEEVIFDFGREAQSMPASLPIVLQ